tara:strand:+ start:191 stop:415 length:225 start_codon:yes stop_codon:yes gene_type:complete
MQLNLSFAQDGGSVYGFVTDSSNGEALIGANVFINELGLGMATDVNGYYVLQDIDPGEYDITYLMLATKFSFEK